MSTVGNADTQYQEIYSGASVHVEVQTACFRFGQLSLSSPTWVMTMPLTVKALVQKNCTISAPIWCFRPRVLTVPVPGSSQISVQCTNNNAYSLALNGGTVGGNVLARKMKHSTAPTRSATSYQGSNYAIVWGDATAARPRPVWARCRTIRCMAGAGQTTPRPGSYSDTVTATITF